MIMKFSVNNYTEYKPVCHYKEYYRSPFLRRIIIKITIGAPKNDVTVLMLSSSGENKLRAIKSQKMQKTAPPKKEAGITTRGFAVRKSCLTKNGTAIPTNETGPANAVTVAESTLERRIRTGRKIFVFTPIVLA